DRIVFQQMRERFGVGQVVRGNELNSGVIERCAQDIPADAAKSVDSDFGDHSTSVYLHLTGGFPSTGGMDGSSLLGSASTPCSLKMMMSARRFLAGPRRYRLPQPE